MRLSFPQIWEKLSAGKKLQRHAPKSKLPSVSDGRGLCQLLLVMGLSFAQQKIHSTDDFDAVLVLRQVALHGDDDFLVIVRDPLKRRQFPFSGFEGDHGLCYLDVLLFVSLGGDEVCLFLIQLADGYNVILA